MAINNKHTHKYFKSGPVWRCALPHCTFFVYFKQEYVISGRQAICWECSCEFPLDEEAMEMDYPQCPSCRHPEFDDLDKFLASKGIE